MEKLHSFYFWGQILSYQIDMKLIIEELRDRKLVPVILNKYYHLMAWIFGGHKYKIFVGYKMQDKREIVIQILLN